MNKSSIINGYTKSLLFLVLVFLFGCTEDPQAKIGKLVQDWQNKTLLFPSSDVFTIYGRDTVAMLPMERPYKVLVYVDSIGCTSCKLQLNKWKELINEIDSVCAGEVDFLFYFHPRDIKEVSYMLKVDNFDLPVCVDTEDRLNKLNHFPADITFQTFLLNRDNKVVVLGNPVHNHKVKELYLKQIQGDGYKPRGNTLTQAEIDRSVVDLGKMQVGDIRTTEFFVHNRGNAPLLIVDSQTSCGCTTVSYDKRPASPGDSLRVEVIYTADRKGFVSKATTLRCNTPRPIIVKVRGEVE